MSEFSRLVADAISVLALVDGPNSGLGHSCGRLNRLVALERRYGRSIG